jgi:hypothetical protein
MATESIRGQGTFDTLVIWREHWSYHGIVS